MRTCSGVNATQSTTASNSGRRAPRVTEAGSRMSPRSTVDPGRAAAGAAGAAVEHGEVDAALDGQPRAGGADDAAAADEQDSLGTHGRTLGHRHRPPALRTARAAGPALDERRTVSPRRTLTAPASTNASSSSAGDFALGAHDQEHVTVRRQRDAGERRGRVLVQDQGQRGPADEVRHAAAGRPPPPPSGGGRPAGLLGRPPGPVDRHCGAPGGPVAVPDGRCCGSADQGTISSMPSSVAGSMACSSRSPLASAWTSTSRGLRARDSRRTTLDAPAPARSRSTGRTVAVGARAPTPSATSNASPAREAADGRGVPALGPGRSARTRPWRRWSVPVRGRRAEHRRPGRLSALNASRSLPKRPC